MEKKVVWLVYNKETDCTEVFSSGENASNYVKNMIKTFPDIYERESFQVTKKTVDNLV